MRGKYKCGVPQNLCWYNKSQYGRFWKVNLLKTWASVNQLIPLLTVFGVTKGSCLQNGCFQNLRIAGAYREAKWKL